MTNRDWAAFIAGASCMLGAVFLVFAFSAIYNQSTPIFAFSGMALSFTTTGVLLNHLQNRREK